MDGKRREDEREGKGWKGRERSGRGEVEGRSSGRINEDGEGIVGRKGCEGKEEKRGAGERNVHRSALRDFVSDELGNSGVRINVSLRPLIRTLNCFLKEEMRERENR